MENSYLVPDQMFTYKLEHMLVKWRSTKVKMVNVYHIQSQMQCIGSTLKMSDTPWIMMLIDKAIMFNMMYHVSVIWM